MTKTSRHLFLGSSLRLASLIVNIGVGFYILPFLVHALGDETYGVWVMVGSIFGFYGLLDMGMGAALNRSLIRALHGYDNNDVNEVFSNATFLFLGIGLLSLVISTVIVFSVPLFTDSELYVSLFQTLIIILGIKTAVLLPLWRSYGVLVAKYRYDLISSTKISALLLRAVLIIVFVTNGFGIISVAVITCLVEALECLIIAFFAKRLVPGLSFSWALVNAEKLKHYYAYGKYVFISTAADKVRYSIDNFVVAGVAGVGLVTHYTIAITLIHYFGQIIESVFGVANPLFNKYHKKNEWNNLRETFLIAIELTTLSSILIGGGLIVLGKPFIEIWMGGGYEDTYAVLLALSLSVIVANSQSPGVTALFAIAKHKFYAKITTIEATVNLSLSILLAQYIGIVGVALGTAIPLLISKLVIQPVYVCRQLGLSVERYYLRMAQMFSTGVAVILPFYVLVNQFAVDSFMKLILAAGLFTLVYVIVVLRYFMSANTLKHLHGMLPAMLQSTVLKVSNRSYMP